MIWERVLDLALRLYPRDVRESRGPEMRDTALEASGGSPTRLLRESMALTSAGMRARARAALGENRARPRLDLRAVASRVTGAYISEWRSLLSASALLIATIAVLRSSWAHDSTVASIIAPFVELVALASFAAFVISCGANAEHSARGGVRAALSAARSTVGRLAQVLFLASILLALATDLTRSAAMLVLESVFAVHPGATGQVIGSSGIEATAGAVPFVVLLGMWSVALPVAVIERPEKALSLARSRQLVRGNRMRTLVVVTPVIAVFEAVGLLDGLLASSAGGIAAMILWLPVAPIPFLASVALYRELDEAHPSERYAE
jgi:hypothetical protein